jgi:hypothetical protein
MSGYITWVNQGCYKNLAMNKQIWEELIAYDTDRIEKETRGIHRHKGDVISLLLLFQNKESSLKTHS